MLRSPRRIAAIRSFGVIRHSASSLALDAEPHEKVGEHFAGHRIARPAAGRSAGAVPALPAVVLRRRPPPGRDRHGKESLSCASTSLEALLPDLVLRNRSSFFFVSPQ